MENGRPILKRQFKTRLSAENHVADYAIGDIQGCFASLQCLLEKLRFDETQDCLWLVGDLVNRGPQSLEVLRFIKNLPIRPKISLGNHDLHLLSLIYSDHHMATYHPSLQPVLAAEDCLEIGEWLSQQPLLCYEPALNTVMVHAGIAPQWTLSQAQSYAHELEIALKSAEKALFLKSMYSNEPNQWFSELSGMPRMRLICNYFTRMRFCYADGSLDFEHDGPVLTAAPELYPWYEVPDREPITPNLVFGHWSALDGHCPHPTIHALDTGCVWGGKLTALCLQDWQRTSVSAQERK